MRKPAAVLFVLSLAVLALALVPAAGLAAKGGGGNSTAGGGKPGGGGGGGKPGGGGGTSSGLTLVMVADTNGNGLPNWADTVTFNVSTTATPYPYVDLTCTQNGTVVYAASAGFYDGYLWPGARNMQLLSPSWMGGAASCTAVLNDGLARLSFAAGA